MYLLVHFLTASLQANLFLFGTSGVHAASKTLRTVIYLVSKAMF